MFTWKSASEGKEIQAVVERFVEGLKKVGKMDTRLFSLLDAGTLGEIKNSTASAPNDPNEKVEA
jgi:hypothetical protein